MRVKNSIFFWVKFKNIINNRLRRFYLNTTYYNNKISKIGSKELVYKPNPSIINCIIKFKNKRNNINDFLLDTIWEGKKLTNKEFNKLQNFFWLFSIDLKSSNKVIQSIIEKWIDKNIKYDYKNWEVDTLSRRIIAWISNYKLTYEDSTDDYKLKFNFIIRKQINHLINEINRSEKVDDKILGCSAIILAGLAYKEDFFINYGFKLIKQIISNSIDNEGFPKSRNFRQLVFYLRYFILIREFLKDSQQEIPDYINETIYYLGQGYSLFCQSSVHSYLFNGNHNSNLDDLDSFLIQNNYNFKTQIYDLAGYVLLKNKNSSVIIDLGRAADKKFSNNYQSGLFSFEFTYLDHKIICNSGYFQKINHQLNNISRSSAAHSTLIIDNCSNCRFFKDVDGSKYVDSNFKVFEKKIIYQKDIWHINASNDSYLKNYGIIHKRKLEFSTKNLKLDGQDTLIKKNKFKSSTFELRFHLDPSAKVTKTIDKKSVLIEIGDTGWRFTCKDYDLEVDAGLFFGKKNSYVENKNIIIFGETTKNDQCISWRLEKI